MKHAECTACFAASQQICNEVLTRSVLEISSSIDFVDKVARFDQLCWSNLCVSHTWGSRSRAYDDIRFKTYQNMFEVFDNLQCMEMMQCLNLVKMRSSIEYGLLVDNGIAAVFHDAH